MALFIIFILAAAAHHRSCPTRSHHARQAAAPSSSFTTVCHQTAPPCKAEPPPLPLQAALLAATLIAAHLHTTQPLHARQHLLLHLAAMPSPKLLLHPLPLHLHPSSPSHGSNTSKAAAPTCHTSSTLAQRCHLPTLLLAAPPNPATKKAEQLLLLHPRAAQPSAEQQQPLHRKLPNAPSCCNPARAIKLPAELLHQSTTFLAAAQQATLLSTPAASPHSSSPPQAAFSTASSSVPSQQAHCRKLPSSISSPPSFQVPASRTQPWPIAAN